MKSPPFGYDDETRTRTLSLIMNIRCIWRFGANVVFTGFGEEQRFEVNRSGIEVNRSGIYEIFFILLILCLT